MDHIDVRQIGHHKVHDSDSDPEIKVFSYLRNCAISEGPKLTSFYFSFCNCYHLNSQNPLFDAFNVADFVFSLIDVSSLVGPFDFRGRFAQLCCSIPENI